MEPNITPKRNPSYTSVCKTAAQLLYDIVERMEAAETLDEVRALAGLRRVVCLRPFPPVAAIEPITAQTHLANLRHPHPLTLAPDHPQRFEDGAFVAEFDPAEAMPALLDDLTW